jgi:hypothetical protein
MVVTLSISANAELEVLICALRVGLLLCVFSDLLFLGFVFWNHRIVIVH